MGQSSSIYHWSNFGKFINLYKPRGFFVVVKCDNIVQHIAFLQRLKIMYLRLNKLVTQEVIIVVFKVIIIVIINVCHC